ncbi:unnamed protein product [Cuscuta campestris]|uniref:anthranilate synthase n=1 Tax=Cuscuta campestris TaxID=132261 RepID=A0A484L083_9ASTE|nr:unnamed protein product [Cuscuta campestris]
MAAVVLPSPIQSPSINLKTKISALQPTKTFAIPNCTSSVAGLWLKRSSTIAPLAFSRNSSALAVEESTDTAKRGRNSIVVIDNYDSFTYNLCQYMGELGCDFEVYRNDDLTVDELKKKNPRGIVISPGPGAPKDSGISLQTVLELGPIIPLFGVCMGLQCIGEAFGGNVVRSPYGVMHGKSSPVYYNEGEEDGLFTGLPNFPKDELEITAWTEDGLVMAARHKVYRHLLGVQFHPESIITKEGKTIVQNFIRLVEKKEAESPQ